MAPLPLTRGRGRLSVVPKDAVDSLYRVRFALSYLWLCTSSSFLPLHVTS